MHFSNEVVDVKVLRKVLSAKAIYCTLYGKGLKWAVSLFKEQRIHRIRNKSLAINRVPVHKSSRAVKRVSWSYPDLGVKHAFPTYQL